MPEVERASHGPAKGASKHTAACECKRCRGLRGAIDGMPFAVGHALSVKHGSYGLLLLRPRAAALADGLRDAMGASYQPRFEAALAGVAMTGAQLERATVALADAEKPGDLARLDHDARGWMRLWLNGLAALGLTPASAARLQLLAPPAPSLVVAMQPDRDEAES